MTLVVATKVVSIKARLAVIIASVFLFDCVQAQEEVLPQQQLQTQPSTQPQIQIAQPQVQVTQQPLVQVQTVPPQVQQGQVIQPPQQAQPQSQIQVVQPQQSLPQIAQTIKQPTMVQVQSQPQPQAQVQSSPQQTQTQSQPQNIQISAPGQPQAQIQIVQPQRPLPQITQTTKEPTQPQPQAQIQSSAPEVQTQAQPQVMQIPEPVQPEQPLPQITQTTKEPTQPQLQAQVQSSPPEVQIQSQPQVMQIPAQPQTIVQMQPQSQPQTQTIVQVQSQPPQPQLQTQPQGGQSQVQVVQVQVQPCATQSCNVCKPAEVIPPPAVKVSKPVKRRRDKLKITPVCYHRCEKEPIVSRSPCLEKENKYQSYFEIGAGGVDYSDQNAEMISSIEFFSPIFVPSESEIFFTDLKVFDKSGSEFIGSAQFGYRRLLSHENNLNQMLGVSASFSRMRSKHREYFNQVAFGGEYWLNDWFVGGNFYLPIGTKRKIFEETSTYGLYEEAVRGGDAEIGYAITNNLIGYIGGLYFSNSGIDAIKGVSARLEYLFYRSSERRFLGIFDNAKLVAGVKKIIANGTVGFIELKLGIGLGPCPRVNLSAFESHMVDMIRRTPQIVTGVGDPPTPAKPLVVNPPAPAEPPVVNPPAPAEPLVVNSPGPVEPTVVSPAPPAGNPLVESGITMTGRSVCTTCPEPKTKVVYIKEKCKTPPLTGNNMCPIEAEPEEW